MKMGCISKRLRLDSRKPILNYLTFGELPKRWGMYYRTFMLCNKLLI
jgi:hypothetical protein